MSLNPTVQVETPAEWSRSLSGPPVLDRVTQTLVPALVRRWRGIDPEIDQAALDQHYVSIHLGGAKRLRRAGDGGRQCCEIRSGAHSVVPAGAAFRWNTEGPVDFVHFYFDTEALARVVEQAFGRDSASLDLAEALGVEDPLIGSLALAVLEELGCEDGQRAYLDDLMHLLVMRVLRLHADVSARAPASQLLAPYRLKRALEFIEENLAGSIGVAEIADATGISAFHFSRAFRQATGRPPYAFLLDRRLERAKAMLMRGDATLAVVAQACGFTSPSQLSRSFRRSLGVTPSAYRNGR